MLSSVRNLLSPPSRVPLSRGALPMPIFSAVPEEWGKHPPRGFLQRRSTANRVPRPTPVACAPPVRRSPQETPTDVIEIDGASNTSVNDIRIIKDEVLFPPQSSRYKIYIIDEVHMLSTSAFNALLKTIEEPPEYVLFIFATNRDSQGTGYHTKPLPAVPLPTDQPRGDQGDSQSDGTGDGS